MKILIKDAFHLNGESEKKKTIGAVADMVGDSWLYPKFEVAIALLDKDDKYIGKKNMLAIRKINEWVCRTGLKPFCKNDQLPDHGNCSMVQSTDDDDNIVSCSWEHVLDVNDQLNGEPLNPNSKIRFSLIRDYGPSWPKRTLGVTEMSIKDFIDMNSDEDVVELMMFTDDDESDVVCSEIDKNDNTQYDLLPAIVRVSLLKDSLPSELINNKKEKEQTTSMKKKEDYAKRLVIITRGTRGDVQPFLALSRGLAEMKNWEIFIVTEALFKERVKNCADVKSGAIHFRPSGGDTSKRIDKKVSQMAINNKFDVMQNLMLSLGEYVFFPSEPAFYYWTRKLSPDYLLYGFTTASIGLLLSEALKIPAAGFVLQPTVLPSKKYPPIIPVSEEAYKQLTEDSIAGEHEKLRKWKGYQNDLSFVASIDKLREGRGLEKYKDWKTSTWVEIVEKDMPIIVPINEKMFGGKPTEWNANAVFTDCIFLRGDAAVPPIADDAMEFLKQAKSMNAKVIILAFSSMPVSKTDIVTISLKIINECKAKVCVFAMVGKQMGDPFEKKIEPFAKKALKSGRLFLAAGAPFGRLFPLVDAIVLHGGLGTTSESLQAQKPTIVTGVLLLDQRFWGARMNELKVGPYCTHILDFESKCVEHVDKALEDGSEWAENAVKFGTILANDAADDPSGVERNVDCVVKMFDKNIIYSYKTSDDLLNDLAIQAAALMKESADPEAANQRFQDEVNRLIRD